VAWVTIAGRHMPLGKCGKALRPPEQKPATSTSTCTSTLTWTLTWTCSCS
jgi:hypothetical protein